MKGGSIMKKEYQANGMKCEHCAKNIKGKLMDINEVISVEADLDKKTIIVESKQEIDVKVLNQALKDTNYSLE